MVSLVMHRYKPLPIGLDIGDSGARAVQLRRQGHRYVVTKAASCEWKGEEPWRGDERRTADFRGRLAGFLRANGFRGQRAVVDLNPPAVEYSALELPAGVLTCDDARISEVVRWEVGRLLNEPNDGVETRYWVLPKTNGPGPSALGVTAKRHAVLAAVETCDCTGVYCASVEPGAAALSRLGKLLHEWSEHDIWGVLDLASTEARLVLCVNGVPTVVRRVGSGGRAWTERIAHSLQLGLRAAEIQKCGQGIALTGGGASVRSGSASTREVSTILLSSLRNELRDIATEVKRSYEYALSCYSDCHAADLVLVGGGAAMRNLPEFLGEALGIPVLRASAYLDRVTCRLSYEAQQPGRFDEYAPAIGLAVLP